MARLTIKQLLDFGKIPLRAAIKASSEEIMSRCKIQSYLLMQHLFKRDLADVNMSCYDARSIDTLQRVHTDISSSLALLTPEDGILPYGENNKRKIPSNRIKLDDKSLAYTYDMLIARHGLTIETYTEAVYKTLFARGHEHLNHEVIEAFLKNHISIGILLQHGYELLNQSLSPPLLGLSMSGNKVGAVMQDTDLYRLVEDVKLQVITLSEHNYNWCPDINITTSITSSNGAVVSIPYIVRYVMLEIIKNAVHSTVLQHQQQQQDSVIHGVGKSSPFTSADVDINADGNIEIAPVEISIAEERPNGAIVITVRDRGGGLNTTNEPDFIHNLQHSFLYSKKGKHEGGLSLTEKMIYSTHVTYQPQSPLLAGLGVGLYLATLYATHFGGSLTVLDENFASNNNSETCGGVTVEYRIARNLDILEPRLDYYQ